MREAGAPARVVWSCVAVVVASIALTIVIGTLYGTATVSAGSELLRSDCGTTWDPAPATPDCVDALKTRSWTAIVLLGVALFGAVAAALVGSRWPAPVTRHLVVTGAVVAVAVVVAGALRSSVIENLVGA